MVFRRALAETQLVFRNPPEKFQPKMEVVGCFIKVGDHFLFLKQQPNDSEANTWGVPGGRIGKAETALASGIREVFEETGIDLQENAPRFLDTVYIRYPEMDFVYHMYEACLERYPEAIVIDPSEHTEFCWMALKTALGLPLIRGEVDCIYLVYGSCLV